MLFLKHDTSTFCEIFNFKRQKRRKAGWGKGSGRLRGHLLSPRERFMADEQIPWPDDLTKAGKEGDDKNGA
jgi:hypothetical protein